MFIIEKAYYHCRLFPSASCPGCSLWCLRNWILEKYISEHIVNKLKDKLLNDVRVFEFLMFLISCFLFEFLSYLHSPVPIPSPIPFECPARRKFYLGFLLSSLDFVFLTFYFSSLFIVLFLYFEFFSKRLFISYYSANMIWTSKSFMVPSMLMWFSYTRTWWICFSIMSVTFHIVTGLKSSF